MCTMIYDKGDIVLIPFPFADGAGYKKRPALVMSCKPHHEKYARYMCLAITSQPANPRINRYELQFDFPIEFGLILEPSWVVVDKVFSIDESYIIRKLGRIDFDHLTRIDRMFSQVLHKDLHNL